MNTSQKVGFLSSITTKITFALLVAFSVIIAVVFYVVKQEGFEKIRAETDKLIVQNGENAIDIISFDISSVMRSGAQLKDTSELVPLTKPAFEKTLDQVFDENSYTLLGSGGIWPDAYKLDPDTESLPMVRLRTEQGYSTQPNSEHISEYLTTPWFNMVKIAQPKTCIWNHIAKTMTGNALAMSCALAIERENDFWGVATINFTLDSIQASMESLDTQLGEGYAVLVDNSNQIVASSNPKRIPYIDDNTGNPILLSKFAQNNTAWRSVEEAINANRQQIQDEILPKLPTEFIDQINTFDKVQGTEQGSMLINYAAAMYKTNPNVPSLEPAFLGSYTLINDQIYHSDAEAYVFNVPETLWKLVIVKSDRDVNSIATNLSNNLIKYLIMALVATAAVIFFMLDLIALRPLSKMSDSILQADKLIDNNKYHELPSVSFSNTGNDEIGVVNQSLRGLLERIASNEGQLANINQQLEMKVEARTAELQDTLKELKNSQVQLIRSEKMATLGQMVAGVAHEVNTPLSYVQNNLEIIGQLTEQYEALIKLVSELKTTMLDETAPEENINTLLSQIMEASDEIQEDDLSDELKELLKDSLFGVEQITEMVLNLRNFARLDESKIKKINVNECVESSLKVARNSIKQYEVVSNLQDVPEVECSPSQINQVIVNLLNNAAQAMDDKEYGKISVFTSNDDDNVYIDIKDNGSGMSQEVMERIFEPFFTTKPAGEGTGLGMAISHQIMEQHGGDIKVKSKEGMGTIFRLVLPIKKFISNIT